MAAANVQASAMVQSVRQQQSSGVQAGEALRLPGEHHLVGWAILVPMSIRASTARHVVVQGAEPHHIGHLHAGYSLLDVHVAGVSLAVLGGGRRARDAGGDPAGGASIRGGLRVGERQG